MTKIHMDTDRVLHLARQLQQLSDKLGDAGHNVYRSASGSHWHGGDRDDFVYEMARIRSQMERLSDTVQMLSRRTEMEVQEWIIVDRGFGGSSGAGGHGPGGKEKSYWEYLQDQVRDRINNGVEWLYGVGTDIVQKVDETWQEVVRQADIASLAVISALLPSFVPGVKDSVTLSLSKDITVPLTGFSVTGDTNNSLRITRDPKTGKYILTIIQSSGVGASHNVVEGQLRYRLGEDEETLGLEVGVEGGVENSSELSFEFDPSTAGDMTAMFALLSAMGITMFQGIPVPVAPTIPGLADNFKGIKIGNKFEGEANATLDVLVKKAGLEGSGSLEGGTSLERNDQGEWIASQSVEVSGSAEASYRDYFESEKFSGESSINITSEVNTTTGESATKVTLELKASDNGTITNEMMDKLIPDNATVSIEQDSTNSIKITYTLNDPVDSVKAALFPPDGGVNLDAIVSNSKIEISTGVQTETGVGLGGNVSVGGESVGVGGDVSVTTEREQRVMVVQGSQVAAESAQPQASGGGSGGGGGRGW